MEVGRCRYNGSGAHVTEGGRSQLEGKEVGPKSQANEDMGCGDYRRQKGTPRILCLGHRVRWWKFQKGARGV